MGKPPLMGRLTIRELQFLNQQRCIRTDAFAKCKDWAPADWLEALVGEVGEYANWSKKYKRGDISRAKFLTEAAKELADVQCYLTLLADSLHTNLEQAVIEKFNEVSERVDSPIRL